MSTTTTRMGLAEAERHAASFLDAITAACEQAWVAGSIRRRSPTVGDIEIVAEPLVQDRRDMFGEVVGQEDMLATLMDGLLADGIVHKRDTNGLTAWGPKHKRLVWEGAPVDLFCADADRFGLILVIRTGPASYSHRLVTPKGQQTRDGLPGLLPPHLRVAGGWLTYRVSGQRIPTPEETDFYREIGLPFVAPEDRR